MRVLHVLHNSLPLLCGYSIRSGYIVRLQAAQGIDVRVVTSAQHPNPPDAADGTEEIIDGLPHTRTVLTERSSYPLLREWGLMRALEQRVFDVASRWKPDIIHAHSPVLVGLPGLRVARRIDVPFVYEVRDLWENAAVDRGRFGAASPFYRLARGVETHVLSRADAVVTIGETLRAELAPRAGGDHRVQIVANGVDRDAFAPRPASEKTRARWNLRGKTIILYAGTFQPYEGLPLLIDALPRLRDRHPDVHLLIAGGSASLAYKGANLAGTQEDVLQTMIRERGLEAHVTLTGRLPHHEIPELYAIADLVAYPRLFTRTTSLTTPLKPLEAMAMGRAVIASDVRAMTELVDDGRTGVLFRAGDADHLAARTLELLDSPAKRDELGTAARAWVERERHWPLLVSHYGRLYTALIDAARGQAGAARSDADRADAIARGER